MKKAPFALALVPFLVGIAVAPLAAQEEKPPTILQIYREMVKFDKDTDHIKNEQAWAAALAANKVPPASIGTVTLSGGDEAWFLAGFDSYADLEKTAQLMQGPKYEAFRQKDSELVNEGHGAIARLNEEWSYHLMFDVAHTRYFEVEVIHLRPGRTADWAQIAKGDNEAMTKASIDEHDIAYDTEFGEGGHLVYIFTPHKSLAEIDASNAAQAAFMKSFSDDERKHRTELIQQAVITADAFLLQIVPEMSYPLDTWIKADPGFWKPKHAPAKAAAAAPSEEKKPAAPPSGAN